MKYHITCAKILHEEIVRGIVVAHTLSTTQVHGWMLARIHKNSVNGSWSMDYAEFWQASFPDNVGKWYKGFHGSDFAVKNNGQGITVLKTYEEAEFLKNYFSEENLMILPAVYVVVRWYGQDISKEISRKLVIPGMD